MPHIRISELRLDSTVVVATGNPHKVTEIEEILGPRMPGVRFVALGELGDFPEPVEDGSSFFDNAMIKARDALDETGLLVAVADDSGLCVDSLGGAPGIFSARFAGEPCDDAANNALLLKNLADKTDRTARFVCAIACVFPEDVSRGYFVRGEVEGKIIDEYRGEGGFGYDPLFYYAPLKKTFAELTADEKNSISHRARALESFCVILKEKLKTND